MIPNFVNLQGNEKLLSRSMIYNPKTGLYSYGTVEGDNCISVEDKKTVHFMAHYDLMAKGRKFVNLLLKEAGFDLSEFAKDPIVMADYKEDRQVEFYQQVEWEDGD